MATGRVCCPQGRCYKYTYMGLLHKVHSGTARRLLADLSACQAGIKREELIRITRTLARKNLAALAHRCLEEMDSLQMRPSVRAHDAVLAACTTTRDFGTSTQLLVRMRMNELTPTSSSVSAVIRSATGAPGGMKLAQLLLPELQQAQARESLPSRQPLLQQRPTRGTPAIRNPVTTHPQSGSTALLGLYGHSGPGTGEGSALHLLQARLANDDDLSLASFLSVLGGYAKRSDMSSEALQVVGMMEAWLKRNKEKRHGAMVSRAYSAAIAACSKAKQPSYAFDLLDRFLALGVRPTAEPFNAAISACRHLSGEDSIAKSHGLLKRLLEQGKPIFRIVAPMVGLGLGIVGA